MLQVSINDQVNRIQPPVLILTTAAVFCVHLFLFGFHSVHAYQHSVHLVCSVVCLSVICVSC